MSSIYRDSQTPSVPNRSPFRIRDSHMAKLQQQQQQHHQHQQSHVERWSFSLELNNMWNMKPIILETFNNNNNKQNHSDMISSGNLLTQLLVSQAILDSNDYKILSFEKLESLKREYLELHEHIKNLSKSIELENRIKNISKSLENINLKNSRNSVLYLQNQRKNNDHKITQLSKEIEELKLKEIEMKKTILKHTAAVLSRGIQKIESTTVTPRLTTPNEYQFSDKIVLFESELNFMTRRIDQLYKQYCTFELNRNTLEKLHALDQRIQSSSATVTVSTKDKETLLSIERERSYLISKLVQLELKSTKLLTQMSNYSNRQKAIKFETLQFKGEAIELKLLIKLKERNEMEMEIPFERQPTNSNNNLHFEKQLKDQANEYKHNIQLQYQALETTNQHLDQLTINCNQLKNERHKLDNSVKTKSRDIDQLDNEISRLNEEIRNQARSMTPKNETYKPENKQEKERLKKLFEEKETRWTEHQHQAEDSFDELLENFDTLTNTAIEFDSHRMKYERTIDQLNKNIYQLESELIDEKVKKIGYNEKKGEPPTTVALRKEFRTLVAEMKKTHQSRLDREESEIRQLQLQLEQELQHSNNNKYTPQHSISIQTTDY